MALEKKIFIVDDNEMLSMALEDYLTRRVDHEVMTFTTGEECMEKIAEDPDVIILDYNLNSENPEAANGAQIMAAIKAHNSSIYVIMLSSQDAHGNSLESLIKGADNYVLKNEAAFEQIATIIAGIN
jgi:two-component system OmpR family response regulator